MATYDAVKWHVLTRQKVALNVAVIHFYTIMNWLDKKGLLKNAGKNAKIDLQFELDSTLLTPLGNEILSRVYTIWAQQVDYKHRPKVDILEKTYNLVKNKKVNKTADLIQQQDTIMNTANTNVTKTSTLEQEVRDVVRNLYKELNEMNIMISKRK